MAEPVAAPERSRHRVSDAPPEPAAEPSGGRRRADDQPVDWQSYREWRQESGGPAPATAEPTPAPPAQPATGGSRRARTEDDEQAKDPWGGDPESTGAHTAGKSVTELLAAHGNQDSPRRHRRRAD